MNLCTSTRRKVTKHYGTTWVFGQPECGKPATHFRKTADDSGASGWIIYMCEEHAGEGFEVIADEEPAEAVEHRETTVTVAGVDRVIRTEVGGRVRTVKQLEAAHTKAVKAALVEMRKANLAGFQEAANAAEVSAKKNPGSWFTQEDAKRARNIARRAERGTLYSHTSPWASDLKPFPPVKFTDEVPAYLVEIEPGHYATEEAAESLTLF
ncbi:hypothetical protein SAM23877_6170 [Streptomyces ambofaciens ATCC 23877]|uniref:Uncharacterized protein n=1 Tax=Streptomyces ambofaciens (strain ATCC 23877 / 3486 / DSM 40053 / JCM 4204 / NBRC 12836 / NRRL B-2516) TaxID=278992 RepID=A0A0K2B1F9_STRA7|nr:hypothetical protein [Streptomyces ambofaciens]AKZ59215.1 hypothetical protein SAM23877_6170 [Streptomyces ambofaciens ATCC 23877]WNA15409.1 hypothetical protein SAMYPH_78 [Streptomyces phage Samy]